MLDTKQTIGFPSTDFRDLPLGDKSIKLKPFINTQEQSVLAEMYIDEFFKTEDSMRIFRAEQVLLIGLIDYCTNIRVFNDDGTPAISLDDLLMNSEFVKRFRKSILNYDEFRATLRMTIDEMNRERELRESFGTVSQSLLRQISDFIRNFDSSPEGIERLQGLIKDIDKSPVMQEIVKKIK